MVATKSLSLPLLFLKNKLSSSRFLLDTSDSVSVFPHLPCSPSAPGFGVQLRTADGFPKDTYGSQCLALQFGSICFERNFLLVNVSMPILGSDFLRHNHLLDSSTLESIPDISSSEVKSKSDLYTALLSTPEEFRDLLSKYPDFVSSKGFFIMDPKHSVCYTVPTSPGPGVFAKAHR